MGSQENMKQEPQSYYSHSTLVFYDDKRSNNQLTSNNHDDQLINNINYFPYDNILIISDINSIDDTDDFR